MPPRIQTAIYFDIDGDEFQAKVSSSEINSPKPVIWRGGDPAVVYSDMPVAGTQLVLTGVQDWEDAAGLCRYLLENAGEQAVILFSPRSAGTAYFEVTAILQPPTIGGAINVFNEFTVTLECVGAVEAASPPAP